MSIGRNRLRKARRSAVFKALPELKEAYWLIRNGKAPRWQLAKTKTGEVRMRRAGRGRTYVHAWQLQSTLGLEIRRLAYERIAATPGTKA